MGTLYGVDGRPVPRLTNAQGYVGHFLTLCWMRYVMAVIYIYSIIY
jgi:hypothetical protein